MVKVGGGKMPRMGVGKGRVMLKEQGERGTVQGRWGGGYRGERSRERLTTLLGLELLRDLAEDRQCTADLSPLGTLSLARARRGGGELAA